MKILNKFFYYTISLLTISCSPVSSSWSCKGNTKSSCRTIKEIDNNSINSSKSKKYDFDFKNSEKVVKKNDLNDYRSKEEVSQVLFMPYIDKAGNRHGKHVIQYIEQKAEWRR